MPIVTEAKAESRAQLTLVRGSYSAAYRTFWQPWSERSGPILAHILLALGFYALVALTISLGVAAFDDIPVTLIFWQVVPYAVCIGLSIMVLQSVGGAVAGSARLRSLPGVLKVIYWGGLSALGGYIGYLAATFLRFGTRGAVWNPVSSISLSASLGLGLILTVVIYQLAVSAGRAEQAQEAADRERVRSLAAEAMAAQANLKLLQAQIEPHFLFNTLANIVGLIEGRPALARAMLEDLIRYLRATLALTRQETTTLGAEADLMKAYLSIFHYRMGERLSFSIDIGTALRNEPIAPMLLQPLIENALKHGLEPKIAGGSVSVRAARDGALVRIEIADSGLGFDGASPGGFGLVNVRERLRLLYGDAARLEIQDNPGGGTVVALVIPALRAA